MSTWIDIDYTASVGTIGYLVETFNTSTGHTTFSLWEGPCRTNGSHKPMLTGWCGETDNRSRDARGVAKIVKVNKRGDRGQIVKLSGAALATFLADDGHPDLMPAAMRDAWDKGDEDGDEAACIVYNEQGLEALLATARPGAGSWDEAAINAGSHQTRGVPEELKDVYYAAYERGAKERVAIEAAEKAA